MLKKGPKNQFIVSKYDQTTNKPAVDVRNDYELCSTFISVETGQNTVNNDYTYETNKKIM